MRLSALLQPVAPTRVIGIGITNGGILSDPPVASVHYRSSEVRPGGVFVAVSGNSQDGHNFIGEAIDNGAVAVIAEKDVSQKTIVAQVSDSKKALALLSAKFYGYPADKLFLIGITGTNGKTTTAGLIETILSENRVKVGVIGTGNYRYDGREFKNPLTTPQSADLQRILADMVTAGVTHVVMEVSSHALDQHRVAGCSFSIGVLTNLTQDHLDYHGDMETYWSCKKLLFTQYLKKDADQPTTAAVINCNDHRGTELFKSLKGSSHISIGLSNDNLINSENIDYLPDGLRGRILTPAGLLDFSSSLSGQFNLENILCAVGAAYAMGIKTETISAGIKAFNGIPGRLQRITNTARRFVFVDYAHTPDALAKVLSTLKKISSGRLLCVFGCGGDRDSTKRAPMGQIASELADLVVVTSDNPRSEDPDIIISEIVEGLDKDWQKIADIKNFNQECDSQRFIVEPDRSQAIQAAVLASLPEETILIAGKGSENYQILGSRTITFDDRIEAGKALRQLENHQTQVHCGT